VTEQRGFSLIELAIVLVIITILIGGLAVPLSAQIQARRIAETRKTLEQAQEAIIGYAMTHQNTGKPYLPCPAGADGTEKTRDITSGACPTEEGYFPWVTLGTAAQDAWGNRLLYRVTAAFSNSSGFVSTDSTPSQGDIQICSASGCAVVDVASNVPVVLVSFGPNGHGALSVNNTAQTAPTSADELENTNADKIFISRVPKLAGTPSGEFDDLVVWIDENSLRGRICPSGGCP
jgi:prepilin-type N-terminal cleavage/methylation domain-containing protein